MAKYLDYDGLATVWSKVKAADTTTLNAAKNDATSKDNALKTELNGTINGVDSKVVTLQGKVSSLETQITGLTGAMHFKGEYDALPSDLSSFSAGDVILVDKKEYVCCDKAGTKHWHELGDEGSYLTKTEASNTYATKTSLSATDGKVTTLQGYFSNGIAKKATADASGNVITTYYAKQADLTSATGRVTTLEGYFSSGVAKKATADANGKNIAETYATKAALNTTNGNVTTLQGYFSSGIAKKATADASGNTITTTYATKTELTNGLAGKQATGNYAKTDASNIFQNSQIVKDHLQVSPTTGIGYVKIGDSSILRVDSRDQGETEFEVYWPTKGGTLALADDIVAITTAEINTICQ